MAKWVIMCSSCGKEFRIEEEDIPEECPACKAEGEFEIIDQEE